MISEERVEDIQTSFMFGLVSHERILRNFKYEQARKSFIL